MHKRQIDLSPCLMSHTGPHTQIKYQSQNNQSGVDNWQFFQGLKTKGAMVVVRNVQYIRNKLLQQSETVERSTKYNCPALLVSIKTTVPFKIRNLSKHDCHTNSLKTIKIFLLMCLDQHPITHLILQIPAFQSLLQIGSKYLFRSVLQVVTIDWDSFISYIVRAVPLLLLQRLL